MKIIINNREFEFQNNQTFYDILKVFPDLSDKDKKSIFAVKENNQLKDLNSLPMENANIEFISFSSEEGKHIYWHSSAHILAMAVKRLYPNVQLGIGPSIENGFYYDFLIDKAFTEQDLRKIEKQIKKIIAQNIPFIREDIDKSKVEKLLKENNEYLKLELLEDMNENISIYKNNDFFDLCKGPHVPSTGYIKSIKLLSVAGAYWRGDENKPMLSRIYGISFPNKQELNEYILKIQEAKKRDHRKLGKLLDIYSIFEKTGSGLVYWHPNGTIILEEIEKFWKQEHIKRGYKLIRTPHIAKAELWNTSGHLSYYKENMYLMKVDNEDYVVKPMNCPGHILIYKTKKHSYKDLPIRFCELGTVYRYERSGTMHGLLRVRGFTQDDAHIFCTPEQLEEELSNVFDFAIFMIESFGYKKYTIELSMIDYNNTGKYAGKLSDWEFAQNTLKNILTNKNISYKEMEGEAVFYGPKIDIKLHDAIGNKWQGPTIQFDFNLPERFDVNYVGEDNKEHRVYMVHRALLGSLERFVGGLIEHYAGKFPLWLAPIQVAVLSVTEDTIDYAKKIIKILEDNNIRVLSDLRNEKIGYKIREAETNLIPYMLIIGNKEKESETISIRKKGKGNIGNMNINEFKALIIDEIKKKHNRFSP